MAFDLRADNYGNLLVDPVTHDLETISGEEELAQRIRATLLIRYGDMPNLDPEMGSDYRNFFGKNYDPDAAAADMTASITAHVPEVTSVQNIQFHILPRRKLKVTFTANVTTPDGEQPVEEGFVIGA